MIFREPDRMAREGLPAETIIHRFRAAGVGLWMSYWGRLINYSADLTQLRSKSLLRRKNARQSSGEPGRTDSQGCSLGWAGWPNSVRIPAELNRELEPDPAQWP